MIEIKIKDKEKYLKENSFFEDIPDLDEKKRCIHCDSIITVGDYKVFADKAGEEYICCPNAPKCNGTIIDWFRI